MNRKSPSVRAEILQLLAEGNSVRGTSRIANCSINTTLKLLQDAGNACRKYQKMVFVNLPCKRMELDEIWSFYQRKDKRRRPNQGGGSLWTWVAIDPDSKLVPCWLTGGRDIGTAKSFLYDLKARTADDMQIVTDGFGDYIVAIDEIWGGKANYALLDKMYSGPQKRYSGANRRRVSGNPDIRSAVTSHVERENGNIRLFTKRFNRKTYCFSKLAENHAHAVTLHFMIHNFVRIHGSLRVTPAMQAGITDRLWDYEDIVDLIP